MAKESVEKYKQYLKQVDAGNIKAQFGKEIKNAATLEDARKGLFTVLCPGKLVGTANPYYEEVREVGFYPQERRLEAIIAIKQVYGYGGGIGSIGSYEYVGLYVNWNGDGDFNDTGEDAGVANVHVFDPGDVNANKLPIMYAVYRDLTPVPIVPAGGVIKVRAILSWQVPPTGPSFIPVWGNMIERWIRLDPIL